jgi:hypothetical protein
MVLQANGIELGVRVPPGVFEDIVGGKRKYLTVYVKLKEILIA